MIPQEAGLSHGPSQHQTPAIENDQRVLQIKSDLARRCREMPPTFWDEVAGFKEGPDLSMGTQGNLH